MITVHVSRGETLVAGEFFVGYPYRFIFPSRRRPRLVQGRFPHHDRGMVTVPANHFADIGIGQFLEYLIFVKELPTRNRFNGKQSQFVAGIQYGRSLRIMPQTYDIETVIAYLVHIPVLCIVRNGIAYVWVFHMAVASH